MADTLSELRNSGEGALDPDPVIEVYKRDVDRTLLRERLRRTHAERVVDLVALVRFADELRRAGAALRRRP